MSIRNQACGYHADVSRHRRGARQLPARRRRGHDFRGLLDMHVAVLQSAYIPWVGYFDIIKSVDLFIIYDDVQYSKGSWRNRNKVKTPNGAKWLTVPVNVALGQRIDDVTIDYHAKDWVGQHRGLLEQALGRAPFYERAVSPWLSAAATRPERLSVLNVALLRDYCELLSITTPFDFSSRYELSGSSTERLVSLLAQVGATSYLSGPAAEAYLDVGMFRRAGIDLYYKSYQYEPYPQLWGPYRPDVTIIDMLANLGEEAATRIRSLAPDRKVPL